MVKKHKNAFLHNNAQNDNTLIIEKEQKIMNMENGLLSLTQTEKELEKDISNIKEIINEMQLKYDEMKSFLINLEMQVKSTELAIDIKKREIGINNEKLMKIHEMDSPNPESLIRDTKIVQNYVDGIQNNGVVYGVDIKHAEASSTRCSIM